MIAEYERAQILERSRRGKRHHARQGHMNVLCGAPYGYRYVRKTKETAAYYEIIEEQAVVVRKVYDCYTAEGLSIAAITRRLNEQGIPTRKRLSRWERTTVWAMLRNPAYMGLACFGKTKIAERQRITRRLRMRGGFASRNSASHERPREEWIEIAVPAIVNGTTFDLARERLQQNKRLSPRRTVEWSIVQGLVSCSKCSYGMCRSSTRSSARKIHYYRCIGSEYPGAFASLDQARPWALSFERWYNHEHKHRNLKFVSPAQRHCGADRPIFANRVVVYEQARKKHPTRWRAATRDWSLPNVVWLNRPADDQLLGKAA